MQYLLLIYWDEQIGANMGEAERQQLHADYRSYTQELVAAGVMRAGDALLPTSSATTVRVRGKQALTTDGPFAETKEALGGYYWVDVENLDEALKWAAKIPSARYGSIEVRPILMIDQPA